MAEKAESGASCWIFWCRYSRTCCGDSFSNYTPTTYSLSFHGNTWHSCLRCGRWCACSVGLSLAAHAAMTIKIKAKYPDRPSHCAYEAGAAAASAGAEGPAAVGRPQARPNYCASLEKLYVTRLPFCGVGHRVSRAAAVGAGAEGPAAGGGPQQRGRRRPVQLQPGQHGHRQPAG